MRQALELALEALQVATTPLAKDRQEVLRAITAIKEALAQPEHEPVACVQDLDEVKRKHLVYEKGMDWKDPLYTTPPQRTWVGLSEKEMYKLWLTVDEEADRMAFGKAVEAKLKEKNT